MNNKNTAHTLSRLIMTLLLFCGLNVNCNSQVKENAEKNILTLTAQIPLLNVRGRIDHIAYDSVNHLAFIAALGNNTVEVVDVNAKKVVHTITDLHEPQGVVYISHLKKLVVANGDDGSCIFFDATNYTQIAFVDLKDDADNIRYNIESGMLYVGYGNGGIAVIDAKTMKQIANIPLDGHPESFQIDRKNKRLYVNVPDAHELQAADLTTNKIIATWKNTVASSNFPIALDEKNNKLFIGYRTPPILQIKNALTGNDISSAPCSVDADDVFYDAAELLLREGTASKNFFS